MFNTENDGKVGVITNLNFLKKNGYVLGIIANGGQVLKDPATGEITQENGSIKPVTEVLENKDRALALLRIQVDLLKEILMNQGVRIITQEQAKVFGLTS